jgi:FKBP-type peptidyl-prolyl cis-trans isomerase
MRKLALIILAGAAVSCDDGSGASNHSTEKKEVSASLVDMGAIKKEFNVDMNQVSYSFGQNIRQKIKQQGITDLIEPEFISSFAKAKNNSDVNLDEVNSKLNEIRQAQGRYPDSRRALSKYIGMYYGATEGAGDFLNNMMVVVFAKGFTDKGKEINALGVNCDSLFTSEKNKYNEFLGKRYLEENKKRTEVKTTASGLQYEVLEKGDGDLPNENSDVTVHYKGTLVSGDVFDSSLDRGQPISFNLQGVIPGWTEGLQLMPKGAKYRFYIPYELGYGGRAAGKIPPYSTLVFEVQLIEF